MLLGKPCFLSYCEALMLLFFIDSFKRNKMARKRVEDLVFYHNNLCFLSRNSLKCIEDETKLSNITRNDLSLDDNEIVEITNLSLEKPKLEIIFFNEDKQT